MEEKWVAMNWNGIEWGAKLCSGFRKEQLASTPGGESPGSQTALSLEGTASVYTQFGEFQSNTRNDTEHTR
jgi:hypothetical protein